MAFCLLVASREQGEFFHARNIGVSVAFLGNAMPRKKVLANHLPRHPAILQAIEYKSTTYELLDVAILYLTWIMHEISPANCAREIVGRRMPARETPAAFDVAPLATRQWSINERPRPTTCRWLLPRSRDCMEASLIDTWICPSASCIPYLTCSPQRMFYG